MMTKVKVRYKQRWVVLHLLINSCTHFLVQGFIANHRANYDFKKSSSSIHPCMNKKKYPTTNSLLFEHAPKSDPTTKNKNGIQPSPSLSTKLIHSLDLIPLMEAVGKHAGTRRGREALLSIIIDDDVKRQQQNPGLALYGSAPSRRKNMISSMGKSLSCTTDDSNRKALSIASIFRVAQTEAEAKDEWKVISEAMAILEAEKERKIGSADDGVQHLSQVPVPPIYAATSSPWDVNYRVDTDDDEWLTEALGGNGYVLELENILQAEQIILKIIKTHTWATKGGVSKSLAPSLAAIGSNIDYDVLKRLHREIEGSVDIIRGERSYYDPSGTKSFSFRLSEDKFPAIRLLRGKEEAVIDEINRSLKKFMAREEFLSQASALKRAPEIFDFEGRCVDSNSIVCVF